MLKLFVPEGEDWDSDKEMFIPIPSATIELEHSLMSLKKWEEIWCKPFLYTEKLTLEERMSYAKCMTVTPNVDDSIYERLTEKDFKEIEQYINSPHTATKLNNNSTSTKGGIKKKEIMTAEMIYYYMINLHIPIEMSKWHLNSLLILINLFVLKNAPEKKMSEQDLALQYAELNAIRQAQIRKDREKMKGE